MRADVTTTATAGGVLVAVTLRNDTAVAVRVRVENDLDGPTLPPRRAEVPAAGWDDEGFTGTVPADSRLGIGYACPAVDRSVAGRDPPDSSPDSDPISLETLGPADEAPTPTADRVDAAVRSLGRAAPPPDAVPASPTVVPDSPVDCRSRPRGRSSGSASSGVPSPVATWLDTVASRVERAERLTDATADGAARVLEECGGVDGVATLPDDIEQDLAALRAAGDRIENLLARATATDPEPVASSLVAAAHSETVVGEGGTDTPRRADGTEGLPPGGTR